jgi:hypothetical protein
MQIAARQATMALLAESTSREGNMAHFAQLDENNVVLQVIVVHNNELLDDQGAEREELGIAFCQSLFGVDTRWKQTSYNGNFRYNFAGIGYSYVERLDGFAAPQPYPSWQLADNCVWWAPTPMPNDGKRYRWDEPTLSWVEITE